MVWLTGWLLGLHGLPLYALVGLIVFAEDALFVGFVIPGEIAAVLGGVAASAEQANLAVMITVVVGAAILGDTAGYEVGRHLGPRLLSSRALGRHLRRVDFARDLIARRGGTAVFLGRFVAFFRATMPALAGASRMPYPRFLAYNAVGGITLGRCRRPGRRARELVVRGGGEDVRPGDGSRRHRGRVDGDRHLACSPPPP